MSNTKSPSITTVSEVGRMALSPRQIRVITNLLSSKPAIVASDLLNIAGLHTRNDAMKASPLGFASTARSWRSNQFFISTRAMITPTIPSGYVTAQLNAAPEEGSLTILSVCCAAPRAGVLVVAPQSTPIISPSGYPENQSRPSIISVPSTTTPAASMFNCVPPVRKALKKPGPTCKPRV